MWLWAGDTGDDNGWAKQQALIAVKKQKNIKKTKKVFMEGGLPESRAFGTYSRVYRIYPWSITSDLIYILDGILDNQV